MGQAAFVRQTGKIVRYLLTSLITPLIVSYEIIVASTDLAVIQIWSVRFLNFCQFLKIEDRMKSSVRLKSKKVNKKTRTNSSRELSFKTEFLIYGITPATTLALKT